MSVYPPREDSELLLRWLPRLLKPGDRVLDMGTGSGVLAVAAAKLARSVVAADISARAVKATRAAGKGMKNLRVVRSDLFSGVTVKFDVILFNPPYLPQDQHPQYLCEHQGVLYEKRSITRAHLSPVQSGTS